MPKITIEIEFYELNGKEALAKLKGLMSFTGMLPGHLGPLTCQVRQDKLEEAIRKGMENEVVR
jgi:hypothetical protein